MPSDPLSPRHSLLYKTPPDAIDVPGAHTSTQLSQPLFRPPRFESAEVLTAFAESLEPTLRAFAKERGVDNSKNASDYPRVLHDRKPFEWSDLANDQLTLKPHSQMSAQMKLDQMRLCDGEQDSDLLLIPGKDHQVGSLINSRESLFCEDKDDIQFVGTYLRRTNLPLQFRELIMGIYGLSSDRHDALVVKKKVEFIEAALESHPAITEAELGKFLENKKRSDPLQPVHAVHAFEMMFRTVVAHCVCAPSLVAKAQIFNLFLGHYKLALIDKYSRLLHFDSSLVKEIAAHSPNVILFLKNHTTSTGSYFLAQQLSDRLGLDFRASVTLNTAGFAFGPNDFEAIAKAIEKDLLNQNGAAFFQALSAWPAWKSCLEVQPETINSFDRPTPIQVALMDDLGMRMGRVGTINRFSGVDRDFAKLRTLQAQTELDKQEFYQREAEKFYFEMRANFLLDRYGRLPEPEA